MIYLFRDKQEMKIIILKMQEDIIASIKEWEEKEF